MGGCGWEAVGERKKNNDTETREEKGGAEGLAKSVILNDRA